MSDPHFFGYGSLVNRHTHDFPDARAATLRGWRREWRRPHALGRTFLSAAPDPSAEIDGLVARVPGADWAALDRRETGYRRHDLPPGALPAGAPPAQVYAIAQADSSAADADHPIKLSYLDVVVEGFMTEFGRAGVERFFATTAGWAPVRDDRAAPEYPRARPVGAEVRILVDAQLAALGVARLPAGAG